MANPVESPARRRERPRVQLDTGDQVITKQSMKDTVDINRIVARQGQTGLWDHLNPRTPTYGDVSGAVSLQEAFEQARDANESFMELPAQVRALANNDPVQFLAMLADEEATQALVEAGLPIVEPQEPETAPAPVTPEATPAAPASPAPPAGGTPDPAGTA